MKPKAFADGIPVYCAHDNMQDLLKIVPRQNNPNHHPNSQIELLARIIKAQGWRAPITISKQSGFIVRGHGRLLAAQRLGLTVAPVDYQDYENEAAEWADLLADNRLSELSEIDLSEVKDILDGIEDIDVDLTGYSVDELLADIERDNPSPPDIEFKEYDESTADDVEFITCPECGHKFPK
jgi:ParB-like chromosome segregation protein Spo0J